MMRKTCLCLLALTISLSSGGSLYANEEADLSGGAERHLAGHAFLPSRYIKDPFVGTYFANHVGGASAPNYSRDFYDRNGDLVFALEGSMVFASLGMEFQQHLGTNWAVGLGASGLVRTGTDALAFINDGANVNSNLDVWTKRRLRRSEKSQLTAGLSWNYASTTIFSPRDFAEHIAAGGSLATAPFVHTGKSWTLQADLSWAYAFNATYGLRAQGGFGVVEQVGEGGVLKGNNQIGLLGEVDFKDRHGFPLGLTLGHFIAFPEGLLSGPSGTVLGFWYTGKQAFIVGVESGWLQIPVDDDGGTVDGAFGVINVKYYF